MNRAKPETTKKGAYAFIDNQNLNLGIQRLGWKMNWRKFHEFLHVRYGVERAYMFIGYMPEHEDLYTQMHDLGYFVALKPTLEMFKLPPVEGADPKAEGDKPAVKGNVDVELALYAMKELPNYDRAIIVSGDGDFYSLIEYLEQQGKLGHVMAPNRQYSTLLKPFEEKIIRLDGFKRELSYHPARRPIGKEVDKKSKK